MNLENKVIKVLSEEHGAKVVQWFKDQGVDTNHRSGASVGSYYGIDPSTKKLEFYLCKPSSFTVIELPLELPKRGDRIMVGDHGATNERIFITFIEGASKPVVCVAGGEELEFEKNLKVGTTNWRNYELIKPKVEIELTLDEIATKFGISVDQLKIKK